MVIFERKDAVKMINKLPIPIKKRYEFWKSVLYYQGVDGLKKIKGFKDHALKGDWKGARSSYLNDAWRVIYRVSKNEEVFIYVERVSKHDYR